MVSLSTARVLARCNGFDVSAGDDLVGAVATPVFSGTNLAPDYLLVRLSSAVSGAYRVITPDLVAAADAGSKTVSLVITAEEVEALPEPGQFQLDSLRRATVGKPGERWST
ncbi:MAG TPA: hypothetical protein VLJ44_04365 [Gaiellaceae bacterium]|nr:hypothetical protein [Gaiellaceae bacterium]